MRYGIPLPSIVYLPKCLQNVKLAIWQMGRPYSEMLLILLKYFKGTTRHRDLRIGDQSRILQMDKLLPRISSYRYSYSSSSSSFACLRLPCKFRHLKLSCIHCFRSLKSYSATTSEPTMGKYQNDARDEDQQGERYSRTASDYDPSNPPFDEILPHILNIYGSRATARDFEIYAPDATFEDPLMCAQGIKQIKSAFYSIPKVFSESRIVEYSIKENIISPGNKEILMDNKQYYKFMGKDINMISLIKLQLQDGKIARHEDWWDKKPLWNRETVQLPLVGRFIEMTRRGSMLATHAMMGFGKDPVPTK